MNNNFFEETYPALAEFEKADFENDREIKIGLSIITELKSLGIDEDDRLSFNSYFEGNPPYYLKCYIKGKKYKKHLKKIKKARKIEKQKNKPKYSSNLLQTAPISQSPLSNVEHPRNLRLSDVLDRWVKVNMRKDKGKQWADATLKSYVPAIQIMIEMLGNPLAHQLTKVMLHEEFVNKIENLPSDLVTNKIYQDSEGNRLPLNECLNLTKNNKSLKRISNKTIEKYAAEATIFLNWASDKDFIPISVTSVLKDIKDISDDDPRRKAFNENELKALFETDEYRKGLLFKKPQWHWSLLIMLYTGCRIVESCQFYIDDICETDDKYSDGSKVWIFKFSNKGKGQKVKSQKPNFTSKVPIHPDLIKLGFLNYYQERKEQGESMLFPVSMKEAGRSTSRWFNGEKKIGYAERHGVFTDENRPEFYSDKNRRIDTRSFRHYLSNRSKQELDWHYKVWCEITHHSDGENKTTRKGVYEDAYEVSTKVIEIEKLKFDFLDIDGIKKWGKTTI